MARPIGRFSGGEPGCATVVGAIGAFSGAASKGVAQATSVSAARRRRRYSAGGSSAAWFPGE